MAHHPGCANNERWKWVDARWVERDRGSEGKFKEKWATKQCKRCGGDIGQAMVKSYRVKVKTTT